MVARTRLGREFRERFRMDVWDANNWLLRSVFAVAVGSRIRPCRLRVPCGTAGAGKRNPG
jgi:hypothetical protein